MNNDTNKLQDLPQQLKDLPQQLKDLQEQLKNVVEEEKRFQQKKREEEKLHNDAVRTKIENVQKHIRDIQMKMAAQHAAAVAAQQRTHYVVVATSTKDKWRGESYQVEIRKYAQADGSAVYEEWTDDKKSQDLSDSDVVRLLRSPAWTLINATASNQLQEPPTNKSSMPMSDNSFAAWKNMSNIAKMPAEAIFAAIQQRNQNRTKQEKNQLRLETALNKQREKQQKWEQLRTDARSEEAFMESKNYTATLKKQIADLDRNLGRSRTQDPRMLENLLILETCLKDHQTWFGKLFATERENAQRMQMFNPYCVSPS
jgi:hypothetical protein